MVFQSAEFIIFFIIIFGCYWTMSCKYRWILLLGAGYVFYSAWNIKYSLLLLLVTLISYLTALLLERTDGREGREQSRKWTLRLYVIFELSILFLFKYLGFFSEIFGSMLEKASVPFRIPALSLLLPVGISFYIFQTLGYVLDVYNRKIHAENHFGYFAASVAFFPILLSGPIERIQNLVVQLKEKRAFSYENARISFQRILLGCLKKIMIADSLAVYVDQVYADVRGYSGLSLVLVIVLYSIEIYCDFSGYSDMATGIAGLLGIYLKPNFMRPYFADSVKEFWKRWHISLTSWFRDYVYIPLGGNRVRTWKKDRNVMITFLLSGLWHGADWSFVFWGGLHGGMQLLEGRLSEKIRVRIPRIIKQLAVFVLVSLAWVFFRADNLREAGYVIGHCLQGITAPAEYFRLSGNLPEMPVLQLLFLAAFMLIVFLTDLQEEKGRVIRAGKISVIVVIEMALFYYFRYGTDGSAFIYFQF